MSHLQKGQSMVEYVIVCSALITALLLGANAECDGGINGRTNCISKLLTVMHNNYDGYSSSISSVQKYGAYTANGSPVTGDDTSGSGGDPGSGSGGGSGGGLNPDGLTEINKVISANGFSVHGDLLSDGRVVDANGDVIGFYSEENNTFTDNNGSIVSATSSRLVLDEDGNILHVRAVTECMSLLPGLPKPVYSWAYVSKASGKVFNSLNKAEMDIGSLCTEPSFKVVKNGQPQGGRVLNSEYFAAVYAVDVSSTALIATGEVVYWADLSICSVMVSGWDAGVDTDQSDEDIYADKIAIFADPDNNLGEMDQLDYVNQTILYGVPVENNDCPTVNIISQP